MTTYFKNESTAAHGVYPSPPHSDHYQGYFTSLHNFDSSVLDFTNDVKLVPPFYPSPAGSLVSTSEGTENTSGDASSYFIDTDMLNTMTMVPPLGQYEDYGLSMNDSTFSNFFHSEYNSIIPEIDLVDQFIAQHEAALNASEKKNEQKIEEKSQQKQVCKETTWSHWTFSRGSSPEIYSEVSSSDGSVILSIPSSPKSEGKSSIKKTKGDNKVTKKVVGRKGRGKGVKNNTPVTTKKSDDNIASSSKSTKAPVDGALYVCQHTDCGRSFTRPYNLTSHMRTHTSERPYACSHCGRRFARQHDRNRHEKLHWGIRPYACHHCHKSFARMDALNRHLRMENGCTGVHS